jgi:uncharacterized protein YlxW (UPF0749 family)
MSSSVPVKCVNCGCTLGATVYWEGSLTYCGRCIVSRAAAEVSVEKLQEIVDRRQDNQARREKLQELVQRRTELTVKIKEAEEAITKLAEMKDELAALEHKIDSARYRLVRIENTGGL